MSHELTEPVLTPEQVQSIEYADFLALVEKLKERKALTPSEYDRLQAGISKWGKKGEPVEPETGRGRKCTKQQSRHRTEVVIGMLRKGETRWTILQFAAKHWDLSERQTDHYIRKANDYFEMVAKMVRERERGRISDRLEFLFRDCLAKGDNRTALAVVGQFTKTFGMDAPQQIAQVTPEGVPVPVDPATEIHFWLPENGRQQETGQPNATEPPKS